MSFAILECRKWEFRQFRDRKIADVARCGSRAHVDALVRKKFIDVSNNYFMLKICFRLPATI